MTPEIEMYDDFLRQRVADVHAALKGLSDEDINRVPDIPSANSPYVIVTHVLGNVRAWVLGIACGQDLRRDRPAEFASRGSLAELEAAARTLSDEITTALRTLDPATLADRFTSRQELFGEGDLREVSRREALLHPIEHASIHLGQIHVTVDFLRAGR